MTPLLPIYLAYMHMHMCMHMHMHMCMYFSEVNEGAAVLEVCTLVSVDST